MASPFEKINRALKRKKQGSDGLRTEGEGVKRVVPDMDEDMRRMRDEERRKREREKRLRELGITDTTVK